jgi:type II secretory pathway pseudopilin PulG
MNRKGTEKPIEIFVALFIILAVALVMLKLFQSQIADQTKKISDVQQEQRAKEMLQNARQACSDKCVEASNNQCNRAALASLCMYSSDKVVPPPDFIDLNKDQKLDLDTTLLAGIGVCEDRIYCFHLLSSCCAREISASSCKSILTEYWQSKQFTPAQVSSMLTANVNAGTCSDPGNIRWDKLPDWTSG